MNNPTFEAWLKWHFDPSNNLEALDIPSIEIDVKTCAGYMARLFSNTNKLLGGYSESQVARMLMSMCLYRREYYFSELWIEDQYRAEAEKVIDSFYLLYKDLFSLRCRSIDDPHEIRANSLEGVCYMWFGEVNYPHARELHVRMESVMEKVLWLPNDLCKLGALYGLGEAGATQENYSRSVTSGISIIDRLLNEKKDLSEKIRKEALDLKDLIVKQKNRGYHIGPKS